MPILKVFRQHERPLPESTDDLYTERPTNSLKKTLSRQKEMITIELV